MNKFFLSFSGISWEFAERKRRVYDQYGKDGLLGDNERHHRSRRHDYEDFDFDFVFRSPDEVFREFFGVNSPFAELFGGSKLQKLLQTDIKRILRQIGI